MTFLDFVWHVLRDAFLMAWEVWWALVLGFAISAIVQAWVPRERVEHALGGGGPRPVAWATGLGAASSSCSYAAVAIGKSLFPRGPAPPARSLSSSRRPTWCGSSELVLWVLIGWQFTLAEYVGGLVMIVLMALMLRLFVSPRLEDRARRARAGRRGRGHDHDHGGRDSCPGASGC